AAVVAGLRAAIETPLGPLAGDRALRDVARADRLDELTFELPLAGGDRPTGAVSVRAIAALLRRHVAPGDPLDGYADRLGDPARAAGRRGSLPGSIACVLGAGDRFLIVGYKTSRLSAPGRAARVDDYAPAALADAMQRAHYPLQALLYGVALHRYLRWRRPGY